MGDNLKPVLENFQSNLSKIKDDVTRYNKLCELNVVEQVFNVCKTDIVKKAWQRDQNLSVHGWIYDIRDGLLQDLNVCISNSDNIEDERNSALSKIFKES